MTTRIPPADVCKQLLIDDELKFSLVRVRQWLSSMEDELDPDQATYLDGAATKVANVQSLRKRINLGKGRKLNEPHLHLANIWEAANYGDSVMIAVFERHGVDPSLFDPFHEHWVEDVSAVLGLDEDLIESLPSERWVASKAMEWAEILTDEGGTSASIGRAMKKRFRQRSCGDTLTRRIDRGLMSRKPSRRLTQLLTVKVGGVT